MVLDRPYSGMSAEYARVFLSYEKVWYHSINSDLNNYVNSLGFCLMLTIVK